MNPQDDDPEARIRDLERPLSEVASASELGTGQYAGGYGSAPPPRRRGTTAPTARRSQHRHRGAAVASRGGG